MQRKRLFPIAKIRKDSTVVMYGAGNNALELLSLNDELNWCNIIMALDVEYSCKSDFPIPVNAPEHICTVAYDYVLVSILNPKVRDEVISRLITLGVNEEKIVYDAIYYLEKADLGDVVLKIPRDSSDNDLKIAYYSWGILGDNVINLKIYQELIKIAPNSKITVYSDHFYFAKKIFYGQKNLINVVDGAPGYEELSKYDIVMEIKFEPVLWFYNRQHVHDLCPELGKRMDLLLEYQKNDYVDVSTAQYGNRVLLERSRVKGWNRYSLFGASGAFDITDTKVDVYIDDSYEEQYRQLGLPKKYITYNFGANNPWKEERRQTKMWPYEYHEALNVLLKREFPDVEIVQIGGGNVTKIPGADRYILGMDLEVSKYVLRNSSLHIDCEGGLVHLASQLGTKCLVVYGPTPSWFLGYKGNINIDALTCGECKGLVKDWYTRCYLHEKPECMYSITPQIVFEHIKEYFDSQKRWQVD